MKSIFVGICMVFALSVMAAAVQNPSPTDAKSLLQKHSDWMELSSTHRAVESLSLERAFVYLSAGAEGELREEVSNLTEQHPDALRFAMQADCWNPANFGAGRDRAGVWLQQFPGRAAAETQFVESVRTFLGDAESRRDYVHDRGASSRWFPFGAGLFVLLVAAGALRMLP